jgi:lipopolysaccharide transport system permease protein
MVPFVVLMVGMISFSVGTIFSILTAKYRDLANVVHLGLRLMMFVTPVFYPSSYFSENVRWVAELNPLTPLFEFFRYSILGEGVFTQNQLIYSCAFTIIAFVLSSAIFSKQSDKLIDVV